SSDFPFSDTSDSPANGFASVVINTLPGRSEERRVGKDVSARREISKAENDANKLVFTPALNANGPDYADSSFSVRDTGGTAHGGVDLDPGSATETINVNSVNGAPRSTSCTGKTSADMASSYASSDFPFSDTSDSPANGFASVVINTLPG